MKRFLYLLATDQVEGRLASAAKAALSVLSYVYALIVALRRTCYALGLRKGCRLGAPVVSIGNLTAGGAGKTPLVVYLAKVIKEGGYVPVILTRGYMGSGKAPRQDSDEAAMLGKILPGVPVLAGADRLKNAREFLRRDKADVFILDDGFQHWRLARDLDIVVIDALNPWGNGRLLPRGLLREGLGALSRADMFVLTKSDLGQGRLEAIKTELKRLNPKAPSIEAVHQPVSLIDLRTSSDVGLKFVCRGPVCAICSIGAPDAFVGTLVNLQAEIAGHFAFMDHHSYCRNDIDAIVEACRAQNIATVVTTQKDEVKILPFLDAFPHDMRILALNIEIMITRSEDVLLERVYRLLQR